MNIDIKQVKNGVLEKLDFSFEEQITDFDYFGEQIFKNPVKIEGNITNKLGIIRLYATAETTLSCVCSRCLKPISPFHKVTIDNTLSLTPLEGDDDDTFVIKSDRLDLSEIIMPAVMLDVEMNYLCDEDCLGLCPKCGADRNTTECNCDTRTIDPRLEVLKKLLEK